MLIHSTDDSTVFPIELIRFSTKAEASKAAIGFVGRKAKDKGYEFPNHYAPPLMPLRERDVTALEELFEGQDGDDIEADINKSLLSLWPEPCWEDDPVDFLGDDV